MNELTVKSNINPLYRLIEQGEHQQQDFKYCINDSRKIAKSLVAFANSVGGRLLIGVKDNGNIVGVKSDEEYYMLEAAANIYSKPKIEFQVKNWQAEGKTVLEITVNPSSFRPHYAENDDKKWKAYVRVNDENVLANIVQLKAWKLERNIKGILFEYDEPRKKLIDYLQKNEHITMSKFCKIAQVSRNIAAQILSEFLAMGCITIQFNHNLIVYSLMNNYDLNQLNKLTDMNYLK